MHIHVADDVEAMILKTSLLDVSRSTVNVNVIQHRVRDTFLIYGHNDGHMGAWFDLISKITIQAGMNTMGHISLFFQNQSLSDKIFLETLTQSSMKNYQEIMI